MDGQEPGEEVDADLLKDALTRHLLPGFLQAYEQAYSKAQSKNNPNVPSFSITDPGVVDRLNNYSIGTRMTPNRPKTNIEGVGDILLLEKNTAARQIGTGGLSAALPAIVSRFLRLIVKP